MLNTKKAPALATLGKGVSAGGNERTWSQTTSTFAEMEDFAAVKSGGLTHGRDWGMFETPKFSVRRSNRLSILPRDRKSIAAYSACHAAGVFIGRFARIGRNISDFQHPRGLAASQRAGESSLFSGLFAFNPLILCEVTSCLN